MTNSQPEHLTHPSHDHEPARATTTAEPSAIVARVEQIAPGDFTTLAALLQAAPLARSAILAAAASRLGNSTVQRAMAAVLGDHEGGAPAPGATQDTTVAATAATATANEFYAGFARRDASAMRARYAPTVSFHDPLFGHLKGADQVMRMWTSIMPKADPFQITPSAATAPVPRGDGSYELSVTWDAFYGLGSARIHNHSVSTLVIADGMIVQQRDDWDLDRWTAQALPMHLGGHRITDMLVAAAAHSYIKIVDLIAHHDSTPPPTK